MNRTFVHHIAFLVPSVWNAAAVFSARGYSISDVETWEGENTLETYVGPADHAARVLLMEPIDPEGMGAYARALRKRGPGLHHLGIDVTGLDLALRTLESSGWLLHPRSIETIRKTRTAWLARPGVPMLIELQERSEGIDHPNFVGGITLRDFAGHDRLLGALGLSPFVHISKTETSLMIGAISMPFAEFGASSPMFANDANSTT